MKKLFTFLFVMASLQICSAQQSFNPPVRWLGGVTAANPGDCNAVGVGAIYEQTGDPTSIPTRLSVCVQTSPSAYAWQPIAYKVQTTAPAVCNIGEVWFNSVAVAGSNWFGCTSANTWTAEGGAGGTVTVTGGTPTTGNCSQFSGPTSITDSGILCSSATGSAPYVGTFTGTTAPITAATHGRGVNPVLAVFDSTGEAVSVPYHCLTSAPASIGCAAATSTGNLVIGPVASGTYTYAILGPNGGTILTPVAGTNITLSIGPSSFTINSTGSGSSTSYIQLNAAACNGSGGTATTINFDYPSGGAFPECRFERGAMNFQGNSANLTAYAKLILPQSVSSIRLDVRYSNKYAGTNAVTMDISTSCDGNAEVTPTFNTAQSITASGDNGGNETFQTFAIPTMTITGCSAGKEMLIKFVNTSIAAVGNTYVYNFGLTVQ